MYEIIYEVIVHLPPLMFHNEFCNEFNPCNVLNTKRDPLTFFKKMDLTFNNT